MFYKVCGDTIVIRLEKGEDVVRSVEAICKKENVTLGYVTGIGAVNHVAMGLFATEEKKYYTKTYEGDFEISALVGNITTQNGGVYSHLHITITNSVKETVYGGHLNEAIVSATAEIFIRILEGKVERVFDEKIGLNVMDL
ncbi:PPC domain-containing DNA-binding protein [Cellulosilyticum sp. I15G10I2]|uniref:PPC domain-containing DNA-binding protein n=1 Tax=Cellulosilyticum sp. I15G10I2 TaxID=1892843 RepID=UPI00085CDACE|nr:PPC domain-containing DNA-binding protein [Cellulosilyticum sp. I15G10I2]